jgi:hypothetical protein
MIYPFLIKAGKPLKNISNCLSCGIRKMLPEEYIEYFKGYLFSMAPRSGKQGRLAKVSPGLPDGGGIPTRDTF